MELMKKYRNGAGLQNFHIRTPLICTWCDCKVRNFASEFRLTPESKKVFPFRKMRATAWQRWSDNGYSQSDPILFLKNDIRIRSESCFGKNHTIRLRKLSESVLWCTTCIFV